MTQIKCRFSEQSKIAMSIAYLLPPLCTIDIAEASATNAFLQYANYLEGESSCQSEFKRWQHKWNSKPNEKRSKINTISLTLKNCEYSLYPNLHTLLKVFLSIPITSYTAERSFRQLRLNMRSVMKDERLNGLALLAIHKEIQLDYDKVTKLYCSQYDTRLKLTK